MNEPKDSPRFSIPAARHLVADLFVHRPWIYWTDLCLTVIVAYGCGADYLGAEAGSSRQIVAFIISGFALFRAGSFIHEITHMRHGEMLWFRTFWNLAFGIPNLMPSFFYENHVDHHNTRHYGTERDGEYLPLGRGPWQRFVPFFAQVPLLPLLIFLRFLLSPLSFLHRPLRDWVLEHSSSFVINFRHRLTVPRTAPRRIWALLETACCLRCVVLLGLIVLGVNPWIRLVQLYALGVFVLSLNYIRNLAAHHYLNAGDRMSHEGQLEDSVNITGDWFWTELFFPLGLRYHALHHLFPQLPYHNLGIAHRRLMEHFSADSAYARTVYPSYWSVVRQLFAGSRSPAHSSTQQTA
jgi:fatty acid desaturase